MKRKKGYVAKRLLTMALIAAMAVPTAAVTYAAETEAVITEETENALQQTAGTEESTVTVESEEESVLEPVSETEEVRQTETETETETEKAAETETEKATETEAPKETEKTVETEAPKTTETEKAAETEKATETEAVLLDAEVKGKPGPMTNLKISFASGKVNLSWDASKDATGYTIYSYNKSTKARTKICSTKKLKYSFSGSYGKEYSYVIVPYNKNVKPTAYGDYSAPVTIVPGKPGAVKTFTADAVDGKIVLKWSAASSAAGYEIYYYNGSSKKWTKVTTTTQLTHTISGAKDGQTYTYRMRPYNSNVKPTVYGDYTAQISVVPGKPGNLNNLKITPGNGKVTLTWGQAKYATGYSIYSYDPATKKLKWVVSTKKLTYTLSDLENGKAYSYRIRPYNKTASGTLYGIDSAVVTTTPGLPPKITALKASPSNEQITLSWPAAPLAQYYKIYVYNPATKKWDLIKQQSETSLIVTKLKNGTAYKFGVRAYNKIGDKIFDSGCSNVVTAIPKLIQNGWVTKGAAKYYYKNGSPVKKMQKVDGKYYYFDNKTGAMKTGWIYYGGYKFYFDKKTGVRSSDVSGLIGKQSSYVIKINKSKNCVTVYAKDGSKGYIIPVKSMICSVGTTEHETPTGTFYTKSKWRWQILMGPTWGQWVTQIYGGVYFHSVYYTKANNNNSLKTGAYNNLGKKASHGCVRLTCKDAKWLYDNCSSGTKVVIYNDSKTSGPLGRPSAYKLESWHTWDPTDPNMAYKCKQRGCH